MIALEFLAEGQVEVVVQDHDRAVIKRQLPKPAIELIAIEDRVQRIRLERPSTGRIGLVGTRRRCRRPSA